MRTFPSPPAGIQVERDRLNKYGRPLLGATLKPKLGLSARNYGRACFESLRGGLDFTKDDENITSQPFMRWGDRYQFVMEAVRQAEEVTGERKGHYLNVTAPDCEQMLERVEFARQLGSPIIIHDYLVGGFAARATLSRLRRRNGMLLHVHRALHAVIDRCRNGARDASPGAWSACWGGLGHPFLFRRLPPLRPSPARRARSHAAGPCLQLHGRADLRCPAPAAERGDP